MSGFTHLGGVLRQGDATSRSSSLLGGPSAPVYFKDWGAIPAALSKGIMSDATSTELPNNTTITYTADTDGTSPLDGTNYDVVTIKVDGAEIKVFDLVVARNLVHTTTHGSSVVAMTTVISGYDRVEDGGGNLVSLEPMSELFTTTAGTTSKVVTGKKAFRYVRSIAITTSGNATTNTLAIQPGVLIGSPYAIATKNCVMPRLDGAESASTVAVADTTDPATTSTGDTRGTISFASAPNGTLTFGAYIAVDPSTRVKLYGIKQV